MGYDNKPHLDRAAKERILADLNRAIKEVLEPPSYGDFYAAKPCRHGVNRSTAACAWCDDYEAKLEAEAYDARLQGYGRVYGP